MKASNLARAIAVATYARLPMIVTSEPGGGKTSIGHAAIRAMNRHLVHQCLAQTDPIDIRGVPTVVKGRTVQALPTFLPGPNSPPTTFFLDEFTKAPQLVMNTWAEAICEGTIGGPDLYKFPETTSFLATGNRRSDRAGENEMPSHLKNRFMHIAYETDVDDWVRGAYSNFSEPVTLNVQELPQPTVMDETLIAFIRHRPNLLSQFSVSESAYPTPRSVGFVNRILPYVRDEPELQLDMIGGCVGSGFALEFTGFLRMISGMFDPDLCFTNPDSAPIPENPSVMYALIVALAARVTKKTANPFFRYLGRISQDFAATCVTDALSREPLIMTCPEGIKWGSRNHKMLIGA